MSVPSPSDSLNHWLRWLEHLHPTEIEMGLQRVGQVADRLGLRPAIMPLILVGGTNGKGSTVALLSEIYRHAGFKVGAYTSPHIEVFNERMRVDSDMLADQIIVDALHTIESAREPQTLTYFEYTTLASMVAFARLECDVVLMEVGLGGRLDATNLWDSDCAILTSIALDHQDYLGDTVEAIAAEKVAIGRAGKPLIVGEQHPPANLLDIAKHAKMDLQFIDNTGLPKSKLAGAHQQRNAACALAAIAALQSLLPVDEQSIQAGLASVFVPGRFEQRTIDSQAVVLDVAHNPAAATTVCDALLAHYPNHTVYAVFSALKDKDVVGIVQALAPMVSSWYCAGLPLPRATPLNDLVDQVKHCQSAPVQGFASVSDAWAAACDAAQLAKTNKPVVILVAGSFHTLSEMPKTMATDNRL